jgi:hypothetical protein
MVGSIGLPELLIGVVVLVPLVLIDRAGDNSGYRKALEKLLNERPEKVHLNELPLLQRVDLRGASARTVAEWRLPRTWDAVRQPVMLPLAN